MEVVSNYLFPFVPLSQSHHFKIQWHLFHIKAVGLFLLPLSVGWDCCSTHFVKQDLKVLSISLKTPNVLKGRVACMALRSPGKLIRKSNISPQLLS